MNELNDPRHSLRLVKRMARLVWSVAPGWTAAVGVVSVVLGVLPLVPLYLIKVLIDALAPTAAGQEASSAHVIAIIAVVAAVMLLILVVGGLQRYAGAKQSTLVTEKVATLMEAKAVELDLAHYERPDFHNSLHRAQAEADSGPKVVIDATLTLISSAVGAIGVAALIASLDWWVGVALVVAAIPGLWVRRHYARRTYDQQREQTPALRRGAYYGFLATHPIAAQEIRTYGLGPLFAERSRTLRGLLVGDRMKLTGARTRAEVLADSAAVVAATGLLGYVALRAARGEVSVGDVVVFYAAVQRGQSLLGQLTGSLSTLLQGSLFLSHLYDFLDLEPRVVAPASPIAVPKPMRAGIAFEGVAYWYEDAPQPALTGIDLRIEPGERIALVGRNGAGKSSLVKLLTRLYDPTAGRITFDGVDLRDLDPAELRAQFAVVVQDHLKYELPAGESIALGDLLNPPDQARIAAAAHAAGAHDRIQRMGKGYDTQLGRLFEGGESLSVGEWQRVALARALVRDAPILVLDEPTSAMDASAERALVHRFDEITEGRTAIVVSHRLSTVRLADRIVVLEDGRVAETGSHDELMERGGAYAMLFTDARGTPLPTV
jgi:ATP-binding cassette, subfamily B, bacterial